MTYDARHIYTVGAMVPPSAINALGQEIDELKAIAIGRRKPLMPTPFVDYLRALHEQTKKRENESRKLTYEQLQSKLTETKKALAEKELDNEVQAVALSRLQKQQEAQAKTTISLEVANRIAELEGLLKERERQICWIERSSDVSDLATNFGHLARKVGRIEAESAMHGKRLDWVMRQDDDDWGDESL